MSIPVSRASCLVTSAGWPSGSIADDDSADNHSLPRCSRLLLLLLQRDKWIDGGSPDRGNQGGEQGREADHSQRT